jgi:hypothetical protein
VSKAQQDCVDQPAGCSPSYKDDRSKAMTYAIVTDVSLGVAAVCVITAFILPANVKVAATPTRTGVMAAAEARF